MRPSNRRGLTLVELVVATGLLALITVAVFQLLRQFMGLWRKSELRREAVEEASGVAELLALDFSRLAPGPRGDLVAEWAYLDVDGDGIAETLWPRLRLLCHATEGEIARLEAGLDPAQRHAHERLLEIAYCVLPAYVGKKDADRRAEGILWRGERVQGDQGVSFFDKAFFTSSSTPRAGLNEVSGGILYLGFHFATQTTLLEAGWKPGIEIEQAPSAWDAWGRGRPDDTRHFWNEIGKGMPAPGERAALPRRVRLELELERPQDWKRRTRLSGPCTQTDGSLDVDDADRLPVEPGTFIKVDQEWMELLSLTGRSASVKRGQRGTSASAHGAGALIHHGSRSVREIPIRVSQDDWNL